MEENREALGEDMDIENLASVLSDPDSSDGQKEAVLPQSAETPVFSDEPASPPPDEDAPPSAPEEPVAPEPDAPAEVTPVPAAEDSIAPAAPESISVSESESPAADSDIDALIKKYEDIPDGKKEIMKKSKSSGGKGQGLPLAPIAAAAGVVIVLAVLKFVVFKPAPDVKKIQPKETLAKAAAAKTGSPAKPSGVDYPDGAVLLGETKDGIGIKIFETGATSRDIKLFYQKKMAEKGFELSTSKKSRRTFNMNFFKASAGYSVSVVPHAGKNLIIVTHAK